MEDDNDDHKLIISALIVEGLNTVHSCSLHSKVAIISHDFFFRILVTQPKNYL